jgi:uncharacterized protein
MTQGLPPLRVLSLDGGGMRGTYTATYLDRVAATFARRRNIDALDIGAAFDLIVGTSTGGIIAAALATGVPLLDIAALYAENGSAIFSRPLPISLLGVAPDILKRPQALAAGTARLRAALANKLGTKTLGQVYAERGIALAIPAVEMTQHRGWVFKTPHLKGTDHRDDDTRSSMCAWQQLQHRSIARSRQSIIPKIMLTDITYSSTAVFGRITRSWLA